MTPDSACGSCRHSLKFHNPCSKCDCPAFAASATALATAGSAAALPSGSVTRAMLETGRVLESGIVVPKGAER